MASESVVKEILLKFKSSGSDQVKKVADSISKSFNPRETDRFLKSMDMINQKFSKAGSGMSTEMKKVTEYFKELNNNHFVKAEKNLDRMGRLLNAQIANIDKLKREGGSADLIASRESTMRRTAKAFEERASNVMVPEIRGVRGALNRASGGAGAFAGAMSIGGSILGAGATAASMYRDYTLQEISNRSAVANRFKEQAFEVFNGNLQRATLYSDPKRAAAIKATTGNLNKASDWRSTLGTMASGVGVLGGLGAAGTLLAGGASLMAAPVLGAGAAIAGGAYGLYKGYQYFRGGGKEAERVQNLQASEDRARSQTLDPEYMQYLQQNAGQRMQYQRSLQMGDTSALGFRQGMRSAGITDEGQMASLGMQFRRFGTQTAPGLAVAAATQGRAYGQDANTSASIMSNLALRNSGGASASSSDFARMFSNAVKAGVNDSALIEEYQKQSSTILDVFKGRLSGSDASSTLSSFMYGSDSRSIENARGAMSTFGNIMGGTTGLMQQKKTAGLLDVAGGDYLTYKTLSGMSNEQLGALNPESMKALGFDTGMIEKMTKFQKSQAEGTTASTGGADQVAKYRAKMARGEKLSPMEAMNLYTATGGQDALGKDPTEIQNLLAKTESGFTGVNWTGNVAGAKGQTKSEADVLSGIKEKEGIAATTTDIKNEGQNKLDANSAAMVEKNIESILTVFKESAKKVQEGLDSNALGGSISNIASAADEIANAMIKAANRIDGGSRSQFSSDKEEASSKKPGEQ